MSLLSTEQLVVFVAPTELVLVRWRGIPRRIVDKRTCPVAAGDGDARVATAAAFAEALRENGCRRARVILSSHFTQYQLLPWRDDLQDVDEEQAYARLLFAEIYGDDVAAGWRIGLSDEPPGVPRLAAAVAAELLAALAQAAVAANTRLMSVQPYLVAVANRWRRHLHRRPATWLVLHEDNRACLALIDNGRWRWVRCVRVGDNWSERLPEIIEHEILLAGADSTPAEVVVFAPTRPTLAIPADTRLPFRQWCLDERPGFSPASDGRFGLALVG